MSTPDLINMKPQQFVDYLKNVNIKRFYFVHDPSSNTIICSHPELEPIGAFILADKRDFMEHEGCFFQVSREHETLQGAFVHRTHRGQAAGGVRYWHYDSVEDYIRDGLRLAKGMTRKNAMAGLWWGGGKGVMAHNPAVDKLDPAIRQSIYREYGELMSSIRGCYVTAEDVGTHVTDMASVFSATRHTTCIPEAIGGSGNPSVPTARGVVAGMEAALEFLELGTLAGKTIAIQGCGNVGGPLAGFLFDKGAARVVAADIFADRVKELGAKIGHPDFESRLIAPDDMSFYETECDIFAPCATGAVLNPGTIPLLRARVVCGAANNQLEDAMRDDALLHEKGIVYVPDFLTNRMGIVNCANEQYGSLSTDDLIERHLRKDWGHSIHSMAMKVLGESKASGEPPAMVALRIADELSLADHPLFGHRGRQIIDGLVADRWHETA